MLLQPRSRTESFQGGDRVVPLLTSSLPNHRMRIDLGEGRFQGEALPLGSESFRATDTHCNPRNLVLGLSSSYATSPAMVTCHGE